MKVTAIIPAAGRGERMNSDVHKPLLTLVDRPVLAHTLDVFEACDRIDDIIVVVSVDMIGTCRTDVVDAYGYEKVTALLPGGESRQESVYNGLLASDEECDIVVIHDGARPLVTPEVIEQSIELCVDSNAVIAAVPPKETIKRGEDGFVVSTLDRSKLWSVQTPQTFRRDLIMKAYEQARETNFIGTDDASLVERLGEPIQILMGSYDNIKITTPEDLLFAERLLGRKG